MGLEPDSIVMSHADYRDMLEELQDLMQKYNTPVPASMPWPYPIDQNYFLPEFSIDRMFTSADHGEWIDQIIYRGLRVVPCQANDWMCLGPEIIPKKILFVPVNVSAQVESCHIKNYEPVPGGKMVKRVYNLSMVNGGYRICDVPEDMIVPATLVGKSLKRQYKAKRVVAEIKQQYITWPVLIEAGACQPSMKHLAKILPHDFKLTVREFVVWLTTNGRKGDADWVESKFKMQVVTEDSVPLSVLTDEYCKDKIYATCRDGFIYVLMHPTLTGKLTDRDYYELHCLSLFPKWSVYNKPIHLTIEDIMRGLDGVWQFETQQDFLAWAQEQLQKWDMPKTTAETTTL